MFVLSVPVLWFLSSVTQVIAWESYADFFPPLLRLTGTFYPPGENGAKESMNTFKVLIHNKEWIFDLEKAQNVTGSKPGREILQKVFPPVLAFRGPENLIASLEKPEIGCEPKTIEGYIYSADRVLRVTAIK